MESSALWKAYRESEDIQARNALLERHLGLVYHVAEKLTRSLHTDVEFEELVSAGTVGLIDAIENFDASRGTAFSTFAAPRIRGAILDDLRSRDPVPRSVRRKRRKIREARRRLTESLERPPDEYETARELGIGTRKLRSWKAEAEKAVHVSLDKPVSDDADSTTTRAELMEDPDAVDIEQEVARSEEKQILREAITELDERDRIVISLYYFEGLKLREIAEVLEVTESRVSQIRSRVLSDLRERLSHLEAAVGGAEA